MLIALLRPRLSLMVAASALVGYALAPLREGWANAGPTVLGVLLLTAGCSALNQVQERDLDARMARTRHRPLASGRFSPPAGMFFASALLLAGVALLATTGQALVVGLGLLAVLWYNGVYTPLKRRTPLALLPGALCGAIAPLIGWCAAGGHPADYRIVLLAGTLVLWQIPHFWSLAQAHREDYLRAGLPSLFTRLAPADLRRLGLLWSAALLLATAQLLVFQVVAHPATRLLLVAVVAAGILRVGRCLQRREPLPFAPLNAFMALLLLALLLDSALPPL